MSADGGLFLLIPVPSKSSNTVKININKSFLKQKMDYLFIESKE